MKLGYPGITKDILERLYDDLEFGDAYFNNSTESSPDAKVKLNVTATDWTLD